MLLLAAAVLFAHSQSSTQIEWQGYTWEVKDSLSAGPGPNAWDPKNVWVDSQNCLHLKISNTSGHWSCAELWTAAPLNFGDYVCNVQGPIAQLDPNVVFSMFSYQGPDGVKELDIEFAKWGNPKDQNLWWTVWPNDREGQKSDQGQTLPFPIQASSSEFKWTTSDVFYDINWRLPSGQLSRPLHWDYHPVDFAHQIPQTPMQLHFNLWLFQGHPPTDGRPVEIIVRSFSKTGSG